MNSDTEDLLRDICSCFQRGERNWFRHKTSDGWWSYVSEDLQFFLVEAAEFLEALEHEEG